MVLFDLAASRNESKGRGLDRSLSITTGCSCFLGDCINVYGIQRAVEDGATVRVYYESRFACIQLDEDERAVIDDGEKDRN